MGVGPRLAVVLLVAGSVLVAAGMAGASTDPEVEREAAASSTTSTTVAVSSSIAESTTTTVETTTTTVSTTTTTTVPATGAAEQLPTFYLRGLCSTAGGAFLFAMSNLGTEPVDVALVFNGAPFDTVTLAPGEVYGFGTDAPGTMVANLPGAGFQTESVDAPCPVEPGSVGMGGLCRDPTTGYQWLLGNAGPDPVDIEIRIAGTAVGTFTVESGGLTGFTTANGGQAEALVAGQVVARAQSSESPCVVAPASLFAQCFAAGQGYRWFVSNDQPSPAVLEFRVGDVPQAVLSLGPFEGRDVTTSVGGLGELLIGGELVASASSSSVVCDSTIGLFSICSDAASGALWNAGNDGMAPADVRLVLDGVDVATVTLVPGEQRIITTAMGGTMEAFAGGQLVASAERSLEPCVMIRAVCADTVDGQVWELAAARTVTAEVRVSGRTVAVVDLDPFAPVQVVSPETGLGQVLVDGIVVDEAVSTSGPCVAMTFQCFDRSLGYVVGVSNLRDVAAAVELRVNGTTVANADIEPLGAVELLSPVAGTAQLYLGGDLALEVALSDDPCEPSVFLFGTCFDSAAGGYGWEIGNSRMLPLTIELRLDGAPFDIVSLDPFGSASLASTRPGTMQAFVNGMQVTEAPAATEPCSDSPPAVAPDQLPGTGGQAGWPLVVGLSCLAVGLGVVAVARRRDHRTPVRS
jgi:hypothetical protein